MNNPERLCLHTITTRPWGIEEAAGKYAAAGIRWISVWREALEGRDPAAVGQMLQAAGLGVVSLVRGGFFASVDPEKRREAIEENRRALGEAAALNAPLLVLVCGADPAQSLEESRRQIRDGIEALLPLAADLGVKLGIEALHPMYADTRSAINTLEQANDMVEVIGSELVGVVVDVYHLWWDPGLEDQIRRCGKLRKLFAFHICDWKVPTGDMLNDREIMGRGCIPLARIRHWVREAGFEGPMEVEIFSNHYWSQDQDDYLDQIIEAYKHKS
jgi:sugar phosphate isomerase/epimerase